MISRKPCSLCGKPGLSYHRYCRQCCNAYMREWRKAHPTPYTRKEYARAVAGVYLRRGRIERQPCRVCGRKAEMHHPDYSRPLDVEWYCRAHHLDLH